MVSNIPDQPLKRKLGLEGLRRNLEVTPALPPQAPLPPPKPQLHDFQLSDLVIQQLDQIRRDGQSTATVVRWFIFILTAAAVPVLVDSQYFVYGLLVGGIGAAGASAVLKAITGRPLDEWCFHLRLDPDMAAAHDRRKSYDLAKAQWEITNQQFERILSRGVHVYWLSKSGRELEDAVADLFSDNGYEVELTPYSHDEGVDIILRRDGKTTIVQCKAFGKSCGPNVARDLFGTMHAFGASDAILVCPRGFTQATQEFARGKPIKLFDVDALSKEMYEFESYSPHWIEQCQTQDDLMREVRKRLFPQRRRTRKYGYP